MELNLEPQMVDQTLFEGEGGGYYSWSSAKSPFLSEAKIGAGKLVLQPGGFALPHYSDSHKIGYVIQGVCTVGMVAPNSSEETVLVIKKGDAIPVPLGIISWWFNGGDSETEIIFLGDTSKAHIPGQFTYFFVAGVLSTLGAFSTEFVSKAFNFTEEESQTLTKSQTGILIVKLDQGIEIPPPTKHFQEKYFAKIDEFFQEKYFTKINGDSNTLTESNFGLLGKLGLSANYVKLGSEEMLGPVYTTDSSVQMVYVAKGTGRVQITGASGKIELNSEVKEGELFLVPKFFVFAQIAGENGMECVSVVTSSKPEFELLAGKESVWNSFSPLVLQTTLGITSGFEELFKSNNENSTVVTPPKN
ncbi:hypothetical protein LguiB_021856 [Lonicera macranthoides]